MRKVASDNHLSAKDRFVSLVAWRLHKRGRRRAAGSGWAMPKCCSGSSGPTNSIRRVLMTWTKPEAEVVAVTMEVTAYVATL